MKSIHLLLLLLLPAASAFAAGPKESFTRINQCVTTQDTATCRDWITVSSVAIYDRFIADDLAKCLPKDAIYISQKQAGSEVIVRAGVNAGSRTMRLVFVEEEGKWKLDVPESLHLGIGDNWEQQLNLTEEAYAMMKQYMGDKLNCAMLQNLANTNMQKK